MEENYICKFCEKICKNANSVDENQSIFYIINKKENYMNLKVKNSVLTLSKQEAAQIARDAINYMVDDEFPEDMQNTL